MPVRDPWKDHLSSPTPDRDAMNRRGGGGGGNRGGPGNNVNRNRNRGGGGNNGGGLGTQLPDLPGSPGLHMPVTGSIGGNLPGGAFSTLQQQNESFAFSGNNDKENSYFDTNPQEAFTGWMQQAGMTPNASAPDAFGQWLSRQYEPLQQQYAGLIADDQNRNLTFMDYLGSLGGVTYGQPGWQDAQRRYWQQRYAADSMENKGLNDAPYVGQSRWLAFG
jgi:hypothetical protein